MSYLQAGERTSSVVNISNFYFYFYNLSKFIYRTAYQSLHKASNQARAFNYIANNGVTHSWMEYYRNPDIRSNQMYVNEWNQMDDILSHRSDSPHLYQPYIL